MKPGTKTKTVTEIEPKTVTGLEVIVVGVACNSFYVFRQQEDGSWLDTVPCSSHRKHASKQDVIDDLTKNNTPFRVVRAKKFDSEKKNFGGFLPKLESTQLPPK